MNQKKIPEIQFPEIEIPRLIEELQELNGQKYNKINDILLEVYNSLYEFQITQSQNILNISQTPDLIENDLIALCQGVSAIYQYYPRPIQLISVYLLYNHKQNQGRLVQINTGEGKTLIIAMLAILISIKKQQYIDIITSSSVLAKRDAEELIKLYQYFQLTVSHNIGNLQQQDNDNNILNCYKSNIVYGDSHSFQGDILKHEYSEQGTRGNRKQQYAIVDEVDSMLVDGSANQTFISSSIPGMLDIIKILRLIWAEICKIEANIRPNGKVFIINQNEMYEVELEEYLTRTLDFQIREAVGKMILPYRLNYIHFMKETWIKKAICAKFFLKEKQDYVIENNQIRIVDYQNTGVIQTHNVQWSGGLHQFVQLKHNLNVSPLSVCTNFMSNICFFKRYQNKLLGLTGTLGSKFTKQLLAKQYNVDFILIPPNKPRLVQELPGKATANQIEWLEEIWKDSIEQINKNRAVLIINESIQDVQNIQLKFKQKNLQAFIYTDDSQQINKNIKEKDIIIATNLAGRGTDLSTNQFIEQNGGLHVIVTFLPKNIRIQEQAFGRTGRSGRKGTARLIVQTGNSKASILYYEKLEKQNLENNLLNILRYERDRNEEILMEENDSLMNKLMYEDECFLKFCKIAKKTVNMKEEPALFKSMEEKWALYLEQNKENGLHKEDIQVVIAEDMNPKYLVLQGLNKNDEDSINRAFQYSQQDPAAVYYKGCFELRKLTQENIQSGIQTLTQAKSLFQEKIDNEQGYHLAEKVNYQLMNQIQAIDEVERLSMQKESSDARDKFEPLFEEFSNPNNNPLENIFQQFREEDNQPMPQIVTQNQEGNSDQLKGDEHDKLTKNQQINSQKQYRQSLQHSDQTQRQQIAQINQMSQIKQKSISQSSFCVDCRLENHLEVYQNFINNIDELIEAAKSFDSKHEVMSFGWIPSLKGKENLQEKKYKQEVIEDGPFPKMGQLYKKKKKKVFWKRITMFVLGVVQFTAGYFILFNPATAAAIIGIGMAFTLEGLKDVVLSIISALNGTNIDWGSWGKQKVITFCSTLAFSGSLAIQEAFDLAGRSFQTIVQIDWTDVLISGVKKFGFSGLKQAGKWLSNREKKNLQNQYDTIRLIGNQANQQSQKQQIWKLTQMILSQQVAQKTYSESTAKEIENLIKIALDKSKGNSKIFIEILQQLCGEFLNLQMVKFKQNKQNEEQEINEASNINQSNQFQGFSSQIKYFKDNEEQIKSKISIFQNLLLNCYLRDSEIQMDLIRFDLAFETQNKSITSSKLKHEYQEQITERLTAIKDQELDSLDMNSWEAVNNFYQNHIRQIIQALLSKEKNNTSTQEPLNVLLVSEFQNQLSEVNENLFEMGSNLTTKKKTKEFENEQNSHKKYVKSFQILQQFIEPSLELLQNFQSKGSLQLDGITYNTEDINELIKKVSKTKYPEMLIQILYQTISKTIIKAKTIRTTIKKIFSNPFVEAIEEILIKEIENQIYEKKMKALDKQIQNSMKFDENEP